MEHIKVHLQDTGNVMSVRLEPRLKTQAPRLKDDGGDKTCATPLFFLFQMCNRIEETFWGKALKCNK